MDSTNLQVYVISTVPYKLPSIALTSGQPEESSFWKSWKAKEHYYCSIVISELEPAFLQIHVGKLEYIHCVSVTLHTLQ